MQNLRLAGRLCRSALALELWLGHAATATWCSCGTHPSADEFCFDDVGATQGEQDEAAKQAAQEAAFEGAQRAWVMVTDKIKPATIQTKVRAPIPPRFDEGPALRPATGAQPARPQRGDAVGLQAKSPMSPGDARNFYQDSGVTLLRNRQTGAVVELLHASEGWVQLSAREGAPLQLLSSAGDLAPSHRWYAEGLLEQIKDKPLHAHSVPSDGAACGPWKLEVVGRRMVVSHREDVHKQLHLTEDGVVVLNHLWEEALLLRSSGAVDRSPLAEAEAHLTTV
jgi:hypothetical protein